MELNTQVFQEFPLLSTRRLLLRQIALSDAPEIFRMRSNGLVNRFIARENMEDLKDAELLVERTRHAYEQQQGIGWAGVLKGSHTIIGTCGFNKIDPINLRAETGGELSVAQWGKRIALEAVTAIIDFGLNELNLHSIEAKVSPDNRGAIALLEYLGFIKEGHFRDRILFGGRFSDMAIYTLIKGKERLVN